MKKLLLTGPMLAALVLAGCSGTVSPEGDRSMTAATEDAPVTEGGDIERSESLPESCDITDTDIANFNRDWGRVAGGVGRPDWHEYTEPLVDTVADLAERAAACPGSDHAAALLPLINEINEDAANDEINMDPINEFLMAGEAWLEELGYGPNALTTG